MTKSLLARILTGSTVGVLTTAALAVMLLSGAAWPSSTGDVVATVALSVAAGLGASAAFAWFSARRLAERARTMFALAAQHASGGGPHTSPDFGADELGAVARAFDASLKALGARVAELTRDRAQMEAILSGMVEGVLVLDRQGRIQLANRAVQVMLSVDASALGRRYVEVIRHPDISAQLAAALKGGDVAPHELAIGRDLSRHFMARAAPVTGAHGGAVLVLHDITDLRRADQVRRDFVANVSHELRTPLTAIRGYVEALVDDPEDADQTRHFLDIIARHTTRMDRLVSDLLRLARLDAKQDVLDVATCDVERTCRAVLAELAHASTAKAQDVSITVSPTGLTLEADPAKLHDIIRNLVENAINYSPERASVHIEATGHDSWVDIVVLDSGPGIPQADLARVFERFYRVDKARARPGGTGLGLAIVRHLVELHGGNVKAANRASGGAQFTVRLPQAAPSR